ncbi:Coiled-coil domain-containing protein 42 homolog [Eumeta japonica]|uniref:Coiled-coil domain-containing protein 42 homolog n=1 Tax=Eumeta variegata TaxID=151549 RepID=A0A4C1TUL6_EUMVA|nr:Coiled-coil domain-containing protein 42 homolog [Eumeta japonica]
MKKSKDLAPIAIPHGPPVESTEEYFKSLMEQARLVKKYPVWDVPRPTPQVLVEQARRDLMEAGEKLEIKRREETEFRQIMDKKWNELRTKEHLLKESFISFNKFIRENEEKRVRAEKKMKEDQETLLRRTQETEAMCRRVEEMESVRGLMEKQVQDYADYLMSVVQKYSEFKQPMDVLNRYEALASAKTTLAERQERDLEKLEEARQQMAHLTEEKKLFIMGLNNRLADLRRNYDKTRNRVVKWELALSRLKETAARRHVELCHVRAAVRALYVRISRQKGLPIAARADDYEAQLVVIMRALLELRRIHQIAIDRAAEQLAQTTKCMCELLD